MKAKDILFAIGVYIIFPFSSILMKFASGAENLIYKGLLFVGSILVLGIFSILWQKLLHRVDLTKAYLFKSTTIIWNVLYGVLIFHEKISLAMVIGMVITNFGVMVTILGGNENEQ